MNLDLDLVQKARKVLGTSSTTETVHRALSEIVRNTRLRRLAGRTFESLTPERLEELRRGRVGKVID